MDPAVSIKNMYSKKIMDTAEKEGTNFSKIVGKKIV